MDNVVGNNSEVQFANGQSSRDLQVSLEKLHERTDSTDPLEVLRRDSDEVLHRRIELLNGPGRKSGTSGGSPWYCRVPKRVALLVLLDLAVGAVSPFAWNYLQSYEPTDDAQIDGHIDPLTRVSTGPSSGSTPRATYTALSSIKEAVVHTQGGGKILLDVRGSSN